MEMPKKFSRIRVANILRNGIISLVVFVLANVWVCLSSFLAPPPVSAEPTVVSRDGKPLVPLPILNKRIQKLQRILVKDEIPRESKQIIREILLTYGALEKATALDSTYGNQNELIRLLFNTLVLVEERYFEPHGKRPDPLSGKPTIGNREPALGKIESGIETPGAMENENTGDLPPVRKGMEITAASNSNEPDLNSLLHAVDILVKNRKFEDAERLLSAAKTGTRSITTREIIATAMKQVQLEKSHFHIHIPKRIHKTRSLNIKEAVKALIETEKFEEAIRRIRAAKTDSPKKDDGEINALKKTAINGLINKERNNAAKIFMNAKKTDDPRKRLDMLYTVREILSRLILSYPDSDLIPTLKKNLEAVKAYQDEQNELR